MKKVIVTSRRTPRVNPDQRIVVETQGHLVRVWIPQPGWCGGSIRGKVLEFSASSRKRMLELLARMDVDAAGFKAFVSLTYPDREGPPSPAELDRDRQVFLKRMARDYPGASGIWRKEWKARQSGAFVGVLFPHLHFLFFNLPFVPCEEINRDWREIIGWEGYVRTEIQGVKTWRQALAYVAKYMAKPVQEPPAAVVAGGPAGEVAGSLVNGAYLTEQEGQEGGSIGRAWGVFNRKCLPMGECRVDKYDRGEWVSKARELGCRQWRGIGDLSADYGFTLFVDDAGAWARAIAGLVNLHTFGVEPENPEDLDPFKGGEE